MNEYLIYSPEGETIAPNRNVNVENCQLLGCSSGETFEEALEKLYIENFWISEAGFEKSKCIGVQLLTPPLKEI